MNKVLLVCVIFLSIALLACLTGGTALYCIAGDPIDDPRPHFQIIGDPIDDPTPHFQIIGDPIDDPIPHRLSI